MKVVTVDCQYLRPRFAASYLLIEGKSGILVDNNTSHSVPLILDAIRAEGLSPEDIRFLIVTHVHLDHAGGSSALIRACPNARLVAHPRAVPHLIDPTKLVGSARQVYGESKFEELYGRIDPIPAERVMAMQDGEALSWAGGSLKFLHTRGHANHHFCILALSSLGQPHAIFTGDAFGLCYPDLQETGLFIFPSTSPTDFDPAEARVSIGKIRDSGAPVAYPTHFGAVREIGEASRQLLEEIGFSETLLNEAVASPLDDDRLEEFCEQRVKKHFAEIFMRRGMGWDQRAREILELDMKLNADGIAHVAKRRRHKANEGVKE